MGPRIQRGRSRAAAAVLLSAALTLTGCGTAADRAGQDSSAAPDIASAPVSTENAFEAVATEQAPVYWLGTGTQSDYLFREFRDKQDTATSDPVAEAAVLMTSETPLDENYRTLWSPVETVGTSVSPDGMITVDMPSSAFHVRLSRGDAHLALQQLVYTVTAAAVTAGILDTHEPKQVRILVDGDSGYRAFGAVDLSEPISRDATLAAPVWLIDPQTAVRAASPVTVFGRVLPTVTTARWEVLADGRTVESGTVPTASASPAATAGTEFRVAVKLEPGDYTVRVTGRDSRDRQLVDEHHLTVAQK